MAGATPSACNFPPGKCEPMIAARRAGGAAASQGLIRRCLCSLDDFLRCGVDPFQQPMNVLATAMLDLDAHPIRLGQECRVLQRLLECIA